MSSFLQLKLKVIGNVAFIIFIIIKNPKNWFVWPMVLIQKTHIIILLMQLYALKKFIFLI